MNHTTWIVNRVGKMLALLAAEPAIQVASFPKGVCIADEIALELDYTLEQLDSESEKSLSSVLVQELKAISLEFGEFSGELFAEKWTTQAMEKDSSWVSIRNRARILADELGIRYDVPISFGDTQYIQ